MCLYNILNMLMSILHAIVTQVVTMTLNILGSLHVLAYQGLICVHDAHDMQWFSGVYVSLLIKTVKMQQIVMLQWNQ